jgi:hypothetical protein
MKMILALLLSLVCHVAWAEPLFYVLDLRHTGDAVLHVSSQGMSPKAALPYVVVDTSAMKCCFHTGPKPGERRSTISINEDTPPLSSEDGAETVQFGGYVTVVPRDKRGIVDALAFGLAGMTSVTAKGERTYEVVVRGHAKPVIVRHCLGAEGVNFRLYKRAADRKPYATFYYALGYDTEPDCR